MNPARLDLDEKVQPLPPNENEARLSQQVWTAFSGIDSWNAAKPVLPPDQTTSNLWAKFGIQGAETITQQFDQHYSKARIAEYVKLRGQPGAEGARAALLAEHYLSAPNDIQRKQAVELLNKEFKGGNQLAGAYAMKLPLLAVALEARQAMPHKGLHTDFTPEQRLVEIK